MKYNYFPVGDDPSSPKFAVRNMFLGKTAEERLGHRRELHRGLDRLRSEIDISGAMDATDQFNQQAFELLTSPQMHKAFDLSSEPQSLRERYGMHAWGQRALLARRLVEAGCSFVTVVMENPYISGVKYPKLGFYNWDSHAVNCDLWKARANHVNNTVRATPSTVRQARLAGASAGFVLHRRCGSRTADCEPIAILKLIDSI